MIKTTLLAATLLLAYAAISGAAYAGPKDSLWGSQPAVRAPAALAVTQTTFRQPVSVAMNEHSADCFPILSGGGNLGYNHHLHHGS